MVSRDFVGKCLNLLQSPAFVADQKVYSLAPFTAKDLATRSLADRVHDIQHLRYLYPGKTKESAFGKYYSPLPESQPTSGKGYVKLYEGSLDQKWHDFTNCQECETHVTTHEMHSITAVANIFWCLNVLLL